MKVLVNGCPKTGTHALFRGVELLGVVGRPDNASAMRDLPGVYRDHIPYGGSVSGFKHVHIVRNPRNVLVSWVRMLKGEVAQGFIIAALREYHTRIPFPAYYRQFLGWLEDPNTLTVRFEKLLESDAELRRIAEFLSIPYLDDAFGQIIGPTRTWTGRLSDWTEWWSTNLEEVWTQEGGYELEKDLGY